MKDRREPGKTRMGKIGKNVGEDGLKMDGRMGKEMGIWGDR